MNKFKSYIIAILYAIAIGLSPMFLKTIVSQSTPIVILAHRFLIAGILMILLKMKKFDWKDYIKVLPLSCMFPIGTFLFQTLALQTTTTLQLGVMQAFVPILTLIGSVIVWKDEITLKQLFFVGISTFGILWILLHTMQLSFSVGIIFAIFTALSWAIYTVMIKYYLKFYSSIELSILNVVNAMWIFNTIAIVNEPTYFNALGNQQYLTVIGYLAICATAYSIFAMVDMVKHLGTFQASVFTNLSTVITLLAGSIFLKEQLKLYHFIGISLVIIGVIYSNRR